MTKSKSVSQRTVQIASWLGISLPIVAQLIYSQLYCRYSFLASIIFMLFLSMPAIFWMIRNSYLASFAASIGVLFWVNWENYIQCISEEGPFVGGLGPIYLFVLGLTTAMILGNLFGWLDRRFLIVHRHD